MKIAILLIMGSFSCFGQHLKITQTIGPGMLGSNGRILKFVGISIHESNASFDSLLPQYNLSKIGIDTATKVYEVEITDKNGKVIGIRKNGKWVILDAEKAMDATIKCILEINKR